MTDIKEDSSHPSWISPIRKSASFRLLVLLSSFAFFLLIAGMIGSGVSMIEAFDERTNLLLASVAQGLIGFCVPAFVAAKFSSSSPMHFCGLAEWAPVRVYIGIVLVFILAIPAMNQLVNWNENIHFPSWASGVEDTLRSWENANAAVAEKLLSSQTFLQMLVGVLVIGVLTGFSEEMFFRGGLQKIFIETRIGKMWAVWGAAAIFSALHFQFFGFFPRLFMGAFFGWLFVWTGSLWPAIFAHALNNSSVVVASWMKSDLSGLDNLGVAQTGKFPLAALCSAMAVAIFLSRFRTYFFKTGSKQ